MKDKGTIHEVRIQYIRPLISDMRHIARAEDAEKLFRSFIDGRSIDYKEYFFVMLLTNNNRVLGISEIGAGNGAGVVVNAKEIFQLALKTNASGIIVFHNHPSGNLVPSDPDKKMTKQLEQFGRLIEIKLLDHLIITTEGYYSFANEGLL